jgi:hypothetical protein
MTVSPWACASRVSQLRRWVYVERQEAREPSPRTKARLPLRGARPGREGIDPTRARRLLPRPS